MIKFITAFGIFILTLTTSFSLFAANPCRAIAEACESQGYYRGGNNVGKGLIENCVLPVASKQKFLSNTNFSNVTLRRCKAMVLQRMQ